MVKEKPRAIILTDGVKEAQTLSSVFESIGFPSKCFDDLAVFWQEALDISSFLMVVDVKLMTKGDLLLKDHPLIKNEAVPLVFFYSRETEPLKISCSEFLHYGLFEVGTDYSKKLKTVLKRVNKFWSQKALITRFKEREKELQKTVLLTSSQKNLLKIYKAFLRAKGEESFFSACEKVFTNWQEIEKYSWSFLDHDKQLVVCPRISPFKFYTLPEKKLSRPYLQGIEPELLENLLKSSREYFGNSPKVLKIKGTREHPELLLFIQVSDRMKDFPWDTLEKFLGLYYLSFKGKSDFFELEKKRFVNSLELFSLLDENQELNRKKYTLMDLNISSFLGHVVDHSNNRFFWMRFLNDFLHQLTSKISLDFNISFPCPGHLLFLTDWKDANLMFEELSNLKEEFPFWRYFRLEKNILEEMKSPQLKMVPASVNGYLTHLRENAFFFRETQPAQTGHVQRRSL